ncbi:YdcF family protein [Paenibacillus sp. GP183]|uniref:YdcF family protein n=1 Tax=Paenibacillus sp. GP183 TaxID=1882751 RepID=UPI001495B82D
MSRQSNTIGSSYSTIITEGKADSTYQNATYTKELMGQFKFRTAIVVTSDFHMRRVKRNWNHVHLLCRHSNYISKFWWVNKNSTIITLDGTDAKSVLRQHNKIFN